MGRESSASFELAAPAPLNLVCFRHLGGDDANQGSSSRERVRTALPDAHDARRPVHAADVHRPELDAGEPRRAAWDAICNAVT